MDRYCDFTRQNDFPLIQKQVCFRFGYGDIADAGKLAFDLVNDVRVGQLVEFPALPDF